MKKSSKQTVEKISEKNTADKLNEQKLDKKTTEKPHYYGHRDRVKQKLLQSGPDGLSDYELLELTLFQVFPRKDVKPLAKKLLAEFLNLNALINAPIDKILAVDGTNQSLYIQFLVLRSFLDRILLNKIQKQHVISSWEHLINYLQFNMSSLAVEQFRIVFLNNKNIVIKDEVMQSGTIDQTPVYPREIIKKALFYEAASIILVHNHPSGDPKPSQMDIKLTQEIIKACNLVNVRVHDHVIIAKGKKYSFKSNMLI